MYAFFSIIGTSFRLQNKMQKAPGLHYRSQELLSTLFYQILFPGRLNRSLGGCQNYRAFEATTNRHFHFPIAKSFILSLKNPSVLYAVLYYSLSIPLVSLTFKLHRNFLNISVFYKFKCDWI